MLAVCWIISHWRARRLTGCQQSLAVADLLSSSSIGLSFTGKGCCAVGNCGRLVKNALNSLKVLWILCWRAERSTNCHQSWWWLLLASIGCSTESTMEHRVPVSGAVWNWTSGGVVVEFFCMVCCWWSGAGYVGRECWWGKHPWPQWPSWWTCECLVFPHRPP